MARMVPELDESQLAVVESAAERRFYKLCQSELPAEWCVLFSTPWVGTTPSGRRYDGEADFIILAPGLGLLVVEVKGGGVSYNPSDGVWESVDRNGRRHRLSKSPFRQATAEKHQVLQILRNDTRWQRAHPGRILAGHAVMLVDVENPAGAVSPESPLEILGGRGDLDELERWVASTLGFWRGQSSDCSPLTATAVAAAESILHGRIEAKPLLASVLASEEQTRVQLTEQQSRVLRGLGTRRRAVICGGAGTGKTLLAMEKALALARAGCQTLLLCYNNLLGDFLKTACRDTSHLFPMTFHELCSWRIREAQRQSGRDLLAEARVAYPSRNRQDEYDIHMPYALTLASELTADRFDAVVIDEGQDFRPEFWLPIEWLLRDANHSHLFVFHDQNQALYSRSESIPIRDEPFLLTFNCRNTLTIHRCAYRFYQGEPTDGRDELQGAPIQAIAGPSLGAQARSVHAQVTKLIDREGVQAGQIAVLVCGEPKSVYYDQLRQLPLPRGASWIVEGVAADRGVRVDTVRRFKGLEADVVFLWGVDALPRADEQEVLYVGLSRAKSRLTVVGGGTSSDELLTRVQSGKLS
jgi:hypothetical protein